MGDNKYKYEPWRMEREREREYESNGSGRSESAKQRPSLGVEKATVGITTYWPNERREGS
jgi:hypothetical protein